LGVGKAVTRRTPRNTVAVGRKIRFQHTISAAEIFRFRDDAACLRPWAHAPVRGLSMSIQTRKRKQENDNVKLAVPRGSPPWGIVGDGRHGVCLSIY
jgi:hypothetical protein